MKGCHSSGPMVKNCRKGRGSGLYGKCGVVYKRTRSKFKILEDRIVRRARARISKFFTALEMHPARTIATHLP